MMPDLSEGAREQIARIIDPIAFEMRDRPTASRAFNAVNRDAWAHALTKADGILALLRALAVKEKDRGE